MDTTFTLDMTMMFAYHDALRRDLQHVTAMTARSAGWDLFTRFLHAHHDAEDQALWPVARRHLAGHPEDLAVLDEMEHQHAALGPLLVGIDAALDRGELSLAARHELAVLLVEHLAAEEERALRVIDRTLDVEQWMQFGEAGAARIGPHMPSFLPWLLDGADAERTSAILSHLAEPAQLTYRSAWRPAYAARDWWAAS